jgi:hypothetical protein
MHYHLVSSIVENGSFLHAVILVWREGEGEGEGEGSEGW